MTMNHFKGKQFQQDVIIVAVGVLLQSFKSTIK
nr:Mobile element protein [Enterococcus faecium]